MKKYDGWTLKSYMVRKPFLVPDFFHKTRKEVIEKFESYWDEPWEKYRKKGMFEIVKVRMIEV